MRRMTGMAAFLGFLGWAGLVGANGGCKAPAPRVPPPQIAPAPKNLPETLQGYQFVESFKGKPEAIGCSDGQREGLADLRVFPNIAGCLGRWQGKKKLRAPKIGPACGDDAGPCLSPADLCAPGWHLCAQDGRAQDLSERISAAACHNETGPGRFVAAMSHGQEPRICPPLPTPETRFPCMERGICSEPVCCGDGCEFGGCRDAVWRDNTKISRVSPTGCGAAQSKDYGGVLCCRDEMVDAIDAASIQGQLQPSGSTLAPSGADAPSMTPTGAVGPKQVPSAKGPAPSPVPARPVAPGGH